MGKIYQITLDDRDLAQLLDGLEMRAEAWEKTAYFLRHDRFPDGEAFIIEECSDAEEADRIAEHYREIVEKIREQMGEGRGP